MTGKQLLFLLALMAMATFAVLPAFGQTQIENNGFESARVRTGYWAVNGDGLGKNWELDSGMVDTAIVRIVPGLFYTVKAKEADVADTLTQTYIYRNTEASTTGMQLLDSLGVVGGTTAVWRDLHGTATSGLKYPVMARYLIFITTSDVGAGADASVARVELFSSAQP